MKNILHISDLHISQIPTKGMQEYHLKKLVYSLLNDLGQYPDIDLILITGDITYSGVDEEYEIFDRSLLSPLLSKLNLDISRVVITPGNHDLNRVHWKESDLSVRDNLCSKIDQVRIEKIKHEIIQDGVCKRLEAFNRFRDKVDALEQKKKILINPLFAVYEIDGVGIGCINSSWLAYENDREKLIVGEWQIKEILGKLKSYQQKILILHHPLDWLHQDDRRVVSDLIHQSESGVKCVFYGHMHEFSMLRESHFADNSIQKLQAGKLDVSKDDGFGGYSIVKLLESNKFENGKVIFRGYDYKSEKFIPWIKRSKNGEFDYTLEDSEPFNTAAFAEVCEELIKEIDYDLICNTGLPEAQQRKLSEIFVHPVLATDDESLITESFDANKQDNQNNSVFTLNNIVSSSASYVILGAENSGKSSLAKRLLLNYLTEQSHENINSIIYFLDVKKSKFNNVNQIKNQLISFYTDHYSARQFISKLEKKLASEDAVIVFDSLDLLDTNKIKLLKSFVIEHKSAKFVMFGQLPMKTAFVDFASEVSIATEHALKFSFLSIKSIQRCHVRDLFDKWSPNTNGENEKAIKNALSVINGAGMPSNPFVYTMLLSIAERKSTVQKSYMHEADLVENFIETILQKHVVNVSSDTPQYKDILLYLGFVSDKMHTSNCYARSKNDLRADALEFNKLISQNFDIQKYIDPLIDSGILNYKEGTYVFSQVCFFNYAYANWLSKLNIKYPKLDESLSFIRFDKVIEYLSALKKSDIEILDYLFIKVGSAWNALLEAEALSDLSNAESEISKSVEHDLIDLLNHHHIETTLNRESQTKEEADQYMDERMPLSDKPVQAIKPSDELEPSVYFYEALSLYARTFRAAEHILDLTTTSLHFKRVLDFYMKSLAYTVRVFDQKLRPSIVNDLMKFLEFEKLDEGNKNAAIKQINAFINFGIATLPNFVVSMMSSDFFNQRQRTKVENFRGELDSNLAKILLTYCLCELDGISVVNEIKSQKYEKPHESSSLFIKVLMLSNFDFSISDNDKKELKDFATKIMKQRKGINDLRNFSALATKMGNESVIIDQLN